MPLSGIGLCEAEIMTPRSTVSSVAVRCATVGVVTTPIRVTSMPALARPAARAWSRNSPEIRVSRPMIARGLEPSARREPPNWRAAASPSCSARSAVMSTFANPRTPSVPNILGIVSPFSGSYDCTKPTAPAPSPWHEAGARTAETLTSPVIGLYVLLVA